MRKLTYTGTNVRKMNFDYDFSGSILLDGGLSLYFEKPGAGDESISNASQ